MPRIPDNCEYNVNILKGKERNPPVFQYSLRSKDQITGLIYF